MSSPDPASVLSGLGLTAEQSEEIQAGTSRLVILMMSAHMDWDWLLPFPLLVAGDPEAGGGSGVNWYFGASNAPAASILAQATQLLANDTGYCYSVCEMGFLRGFAQVDPATFATFAANADRVHLSGAGITSPDNLLPHGEAFIRNYLVGRTWAENALPAATCSQCYVPDDFGHDPELPVTLQAMGMQGTAFARLPGIWIDNPDNQTPPDGATLQAITLFENRQIDFVWRASDGSTALAHWMPSWYGGAGPADLASPAALQAFLEKKLGPDTSQDILVSSPTSYVYVPMANDFQTPIATVASVCRAWNQTPPVIDGQTTFCVPGTFDKFIELLSAAGGLVTLGGKGNPPFFSTPYMAGAQASRPLLKIMHHQAVRALLAAEMFGVIAAKSGAPLWSDPAAVEAQAPANVLLDAWNLVAPSTHHDFITGTAHPYVYRTEQLPLLATAVSRAEWLREDALTGVASTLSPPVPNSSVAIFNQLGFQRRALVECDPNAIGNASQISSGGQTSPVQSAEDGRSLFLATLPPLGYATASPTGGSESHVADSVTVTPDHADAPAEITLENPYVRVVLSAASGWGVTSFFDKNASREVIPAGAVGNTISIFLDTGTEYAFGCEKTGGTFADSGISQTVQSVEQVENGTLRAVVRVTTTCPSPSSDGVTLTYVREYALQSSEAILRMAVTGQAPLKDEYQTGTTILVRFPLAASIDTVVRGTPTHWTSQMPQIVWNGFTPYAAHNFALAYSGGMPVAGVLPLDSPAWGLMWNWSGSAWTNDGALYGALLRNTPGSYYGWTYAGPPFPGGTDDEVHTVRYALIGPSACGDPTKGDALKQGLHFANPPRVAPLTPYSTPDASPPADYALAQVTPPALLTAAKLGTRNPNSLVFRVYQPSNQALSNVGLTFDPTTVPGWSPGKTVVAELVTALEESIGRLAVNGTTATFGMPNALATIALSVAS